MRVPRITLQTFKTQKGKNQVFTPRWFIHPYQKKNVVPLARWGDAWLLQCACSGAACGVQGAARTSGSDQCACDNPQERVHTPMAFRYERRGEVWPRRKVAIDSGYQKSFSLHHSKGIWKREGGHRDKVWAELALEWKAAAHVQCPVHRRACQSGDDSCYLCPSGPHGFLIQLIVHRAVLSLNHKLKD